MEEYTYNTMNTSMPSCATMRHAAYTKLSGHWLYPVLTMLLYMVVNGAAGCLCIGSIFVTMPLSFGFCITFLLFMRDMTGDDEMVTRPFHVFRQYGRYLGGSILVALFTMLWTLLLIVPGIVKSYSYRMTAYIMHDNPDIPVSECIRKSQQMMSGHKWKLFCLDLSFIGWILLGIITFGIAMLWVTPYMATASAHFYVELKSRNQ